MSDQLEGSAPTEQVPEGSTEQPQAKDTSSDTVKYDTYRKVLGEKKARDAKIAELEEQLNQLQSAEKQRVETELAEQNQWKELAEMRAKEAEELKVRVQQYNVEQETASKLDAFLGALDGKVDRKYWGLIDLDRIIVNPDSKEVDDMSVTKVVEEFRKEHGRLIDTTKGPKIPSVAPSGSAATGRTKQDILTDAAQLFGKRF